MNFLQPAILWAIPLIALPIVIHLINQWRYQTRPWAPMMFLLQANRMNRGMAKLRQWFILAMRTLAVAGFLFAISRPLVGGFWGMLAGGQVDTTIVLIDRSPSMNEQGALGETKREAAVRQLTSALATVGSSRWVVIDTVTAEATEFESSDSLWKSAATSPSSAQAQWPLSILSALEYIQINQPGSVDLWLCSDLRANDWKAESGDWSLIRSGFQALPQQVRFSLLAYSEAPADNLSIRVTKAYRREKSEQTSATNELILSIQVVDTGRGPSLQARSVPVQIEVEGVRSQLDMELRAGLAEVRELSIPLPVQKQSGWGKVSLPADSNNADNDYYFVFESSASNRIVLVTDDPPAARVLQIAAGVTADGVGSSQLVVRSPDRLDSRELDGAALVIWQSDLPDALTANSLDVYVAGGGRLLFFPPVGLPKGIGDLTRQYHGVRWTGWKQPGLHPAWIAHWRSDQDLLAATSSGAGLPVGQLEIRGHGLLHSDSELTPLAILEEGHPLLARLPTNAGAVYFCGAGTDPNQSSLAENGVVLFVVLQRAIQDGQAALEGNRQRDARSSRLGIQVAKLNSLDAGSFSGRGLDESVSGPDSQILEELNWQQVAGPTSVSNEFDQQAGVYRVGDRLIAVNRPADEDQTKVIDESKIAALFEGLAFEKIDQKADSQSSIFREIWRLFLLLVIVALLLEAVLCLPKARGVVTQGKVLWSGRG